MGPCRWKYEVRLQQRCLNVTAGHHVWQSVRRPTITIGKKVGEKMKYIGGQLKQRQTI